MTAGTVAAPAAGRATTARSAVSVRQLMAAEQLAAKISAFPERAAGVARFQGGAGPHPAFAQP